MTTATAEHAFTAETLITHNGRITVTNNATGGHRTFEIKTIRKEGHALDGKRVLSLLTGPDNTGDYTPFAFVDSWNKTIRPSVPSSHPDAAGVWTEPRLSVNVYKKKRGTHGKPSAYEKYRDMFINITRLVEQGSVTVQFEGGDPHDFADFARYAPHEEACYTAIKCVENVVKILGERHGK